MPNKLSFSTVDVFTSERFKGNQLAIIQLPPGSTLSQDGKQRIAREFNFSESVFLQQAPPDSRHSHSVDIFTPSEELPFAGHPIIGTLAYIFWCSNPELKKTQLHTKAGPIIGVVRDTGLVEAEIPHKVRVHALPVPAAAIEKSQSSLRNTSALLEPLRLVSIVKGMSYVLAQLPSVDPLLQSLVAQDQRIDHDAIHFDDGWTPSFTGIYYYVIESREVSKAHTSNYRIRTRMLEPSVFEDAATGSAASALASYLALKEGKPGGAFDFEIEQGVEMGRASQIHVHLLLDAQGTAVKSITIGGRAVLVTEGTLHLPGS